MKRTYRLTGAGLFLATLLTTGCGRPAEEATSPPTARPTAATPASDTAVPAAELKTVTLRVEGMT